MKQNQSLWTILLKTNGRHGLAQPAFARLLLRLGLLLLFFCPLRMGFGAAFNARLDVAESGTGADVSWTSQSLTPSAPFVHYEFQIQLSTDLTTWESAETPIPGGFLGSGAVPHMYHLSATNAHRFVRLTYRLNMPGASLAGLDLSGADLRGANLAGANLVGTKLDGTRLGGADLAGANLAGATFAGANLQDLSLDGIGLTGFDLTGIRGTPRLTQITADATGAAAQLVPMLPYNATPASYDFTTTNPNLPGAISMNSAMILLKTNATVGQVNALLAAHGASILASSPRDTLLPNAVLMVRFPTTNAQALYDLTVSLNNDPIVAAAAPDVLVGPTMVPNDASAPPDWKWDDAGTAAGGNWGLEYARVPQMWNLRTALQKKGVARTPTCVIDVYFNPAHDDLHFEYLIGSPPLQVDDHGNHVSGIIGATFDNNVGIDGVNPMPYLIGYTFRAMAEDSPNPALPHGDFEPARQANGYSMIQDVRDALRQAPETKIINMSLGYNWSHYTNATRPFVNSPFTAEQLQSIEFIANKYGVLMAGVAYSASSVLIVCSAGNDFQKIPASLNSPMSTAALVLGAPNILVVESHGPTGGLSSFSNDGGHVAAPGEAILSVQGSNNTQYATYDGTSMATPFVSGLAGFLLMADPTLTPSSTISLIRAHGQNVDAYTSLMEIDNRPGHDRGILKLLLDIDDGTEDGCERVPVPGATLGQDRAFVRVDGPDVIGFDLHGDGKIDMSDFRRWRDWLVYSEGHSALNGSGFHPKLDGNGNRDPHPFDDQFHFPQGDFNGDGKLDETSDRSVAGWFSDFSFTDIGVLISSDLWEDPDYPNVTKLLDLMHSADFNISVENFYYKHTDIDDPGMVWVYDADTREPVADGGARTFTADDPVHLLTVPVGARYFVASAPISIGTGTNVQMRSIGEFMVGENDRGADFAVDLALVEMTTVADTLNPDAHLIDSRPDADQVEAYLAAGAGGNGAQSVGSRAWATNSGTFYAVARAGSTLVPPPDPSKATTFSSAVRWERSFIKDESQPDPTFLVKPMVLKLGGSGPNGTDINAFAEIVVEMRAYDISPAWQPMFIYHAEIAGHAGTGGNASTFHIVGQEGDLPPKTLTLNGNFGAEYRQQKHRGTIDLDGVLNGHSFEVRYRLNARTTGRGGDGEASAYVGDPLEYGSGIRMEYGSFGELPLIRSVAIDPQGQGMVSYLSHTNFYYRLYRGADADTTGLPVAMKLGIEGLDTLTDPAPPANATPDDYTLENQPVSQPLDLDGDGIDDVYELLHPTILNPLNASDAYLDSDGDGRSNLQEYLDGTDPQVPDAPASPLLQFPGIVVPTFPGGELIDLNNDGLLDSAGPQLTAALAHIGGSFRPPTNSPAPGVRINSGTAFLKLDGDAFPDAVVIDLLTNRIFVFRGAGDGGFAPLSSYPGISDARQIVPCNLNGDSQTDIAVWSMSGRGADLHINNGDGTLTTIATLTTNAYGTARGMALGDFNNDQRDDVVVGYAANVAVFLSTNGSYGPAQAYPVGSSPESIAIADLNKDGRPDIITANRSSGDLSVLFGAAGGTFLGQVKYTVGALPLGLRVVDLNGDTFPDVLVARVSADYLTVFLNQGNGALGTPYTVPIGTSFNGLADWDGDGRLDLLSSLSGIGTLVNPGRGDGTFDTRLQIVPTNSPPVRVQPVDLNGDQRLELVGLTTQGNSIDVWEHAAVNGTNRLLSRFTVGPYVTSFTHGDFNGDGRPDLAVLTQTNSFGTPGSNQVIVLTNQGGFVFQDAGHYPLTGKPNNVVAGDFNGDGRLDLAIDLGGGTLNGGSRLVALVGDGAGGFTTGAPAAIGTTLSFMAPADSNGDGRAEVVVRGSRLTGSTFTDFLEVFALDAGSGWTNRQTLSFTNDFDSIQISDVNGDNLPDVVIAATDPVTGIKSLRSYAASAAGFGVQTVVADNVEFAYFNRLADLNGDGRMDVISGYELFLANPNGGFHPGQIIWVGAVGVEHVADFNRDGKPDLMSGLSVLLQK